MSRLLSYLRPQRARLWFSISSSALNKVFDLAPPILVAWLIDTVLLRPPPWLPAVADTTDPFRQVVFLAGLAVVVFGFESAFQWMYAYGFMTLAQNLQHTLRVDAYRRMQDREMEFFEEHRLGKTLAMLNDDVNQLERFLNTSFGEIVRLVVLVVFACTVLFAKSWELALIGLAPVPVIIFGSLWYSKLLEPRYKRVREAVGELAARLENNIAGILVIKSFTAESYEAGRVEDASDVYRQANRDAIKLSAAFVPLIRMIVVVGFAGVMIMGGYWTLEGKLSIGTLVLFTMMIQRLLWPMTRLGEVFDEYQRAKASAARIFSLLDTESRIVDPAHGAGPAESPGEVAFRNVHFRYRRGEPILRGIELTIAPGETVGVAGPTGSGKSTLIKLLLRLYDVTEGSVQVDGHDVREFAQQELRGRIALVSQDVYVFHGTIGENIAYGHGDGNGGELSIEAVTAAARLAHLDAFVQTLADGYDTIVGERGIQLSGGQRQRLSLARAILKDAPILVLDEATSSVDTETERAIQENLAELTAGRTALVIAHRLSTIRAADRIVVVDEGRVIEEGTHDELVAAGGTYADLWNLQSGTARAQTPNL